MLAETNSPCTDCYSQKICVVELSSTTEVLQKQHAIILQLKEEVSSTLGIKSMLMMSSVAKEPKSSSVIPSTVCSDEGWSRTAGNSVWGRLRNRQSKQNNIWWYNMIMQRHGDEHAWLLPLEITLIALVYPSFKLIWAQAIIITLFWPLLWHWNCLFKTKNYQSMFNWHFAITTRIASRNHFVHKLVLYQHSLSFLKASDFNCSIFPQVLPVSLRWKQLSLMTKAS